MKIKHAVCAPGRTGFFFDDQAAIKGGALPDGSVYVGKTVTDGFTSVRQAGEAVSVLFVLEDGQVAFGDCAAVQYSGAGGRDPLFLASDFIPVIEKHVLPEFIGADLSAFRPLADKLESINIDGKPLHTAIRYGVSQALLDAVAKSNGEMMCETAAREYGTEVSDRMIPIFTQSGDARRENADKMIVKGADVLPHALINNVETKLGKNGELLLDYLAWLRDRVIALRSHHSYNPILHIDVYGTIGECFGHTNYDAMAEYIARLAETAKPFKLRIEGPMDAGSRALQIEALATLTETIDARGIPVELVADEWCNTLEDVKEFADRRAGHMIQVKTPDLGGIGNTAEAVLYCKERGVGAYQGGTCNETDRSAVVCAHIAMATSPAQILAKPGMGVDEGIMISYNEMQRILALKHLEGRGK